MTKAKRILISGHYGEGNAGDEALLISMLEQLRKLDLNLVFEVISNNPSLSKNYCNEEFIYSGRFGFAEPNKSGFEKYKWIIKTIKSLVKCDLLITGGGAILQDKTSRLFIPFWFSKIFLAQILRKKTAFYGIGAGPLKTKTSKLIVNLFAKHMDFITLRGNLSKAELSEICPGLSNVLVTADPALTLESSKIDHVNKILKTEAISLEKQKLTIGINLRNYNKKNQKKFEGGQWKAESVDKEGDIVNEVSRFVERIIRDYGYNVLFIPMCIFDPQDDRKMAKRILEKVKERNPNLSIKNIGIIQGDYKPQEIKGLVAQCDLFIGMRLHSLIFSTANCIPSMGLAYTLKTFDFMETINLEDYVLDVSKITCDLLERKFTSLLENKQLIKKSLEDKMIIEKAKAIKNAKLVSDVLLT